MSIPWPASHRYGAVPAPGGLGLVHDFLNTVGVATYGPDLLAHTTPARDWVDGAVRTWSALRAVEEQPRALDDADLAKLRALRTTITRLIAGEPPEDSMRSVSASFALSDSGEVRLDPAGNGWRWLASALWGEILLSQQHDTWRRLKTCHNHQCGSVFYDRSKNNSGVWCSVKTCGNAANLRASRARKREREQKAEAG